MEGKVATDEERPSVQDVTKKFSVFEDGAFALQVQEELNCEHYQGNISRRRTVRSDLVVAKDQAESEALEAFREEHEIAERNRQIEKKDDEAAREIYKKMMKEENEKAEQEQEKDKEIAREMQLKEKEEFIRLKKKQLERENLMASERLARSISREDKEKFQKKAVTDSEDAMAALRITQEEETEEDLPVSLKVDIGGGGENGVPDVADDALIARQLQEHEKDKYNLAKKKQKERTSLKESERLAKSLHLEEREKAERHRGGRDPPFSDRDGRTMDSENGGEIRIRRAPEFEDDEMIARQIHREEVQRANSSETEEERLRRELHDAELARKMQHAEVVRARNRRQRDLERRSDAEFASSEDRVRYHEDSGHRHDPDRIHRYDPDRNRRQDPDRNRRHDTDRTRHDPEREQRHDPERERRHDPERAGRHDFDRGHQNNRDQRKERQQEEPLPSGQGSGVDPRLIERNPMADAYPKAAESTRGHPTGQGQIQPIAGQKRQNTKEREKSKEKERKSKGLFSKSKKK